MALFANEVPEGWEPGDFIQIEDEEFDAASEPGGLIAISTVNRDGYLTPAAAERLAKFLAVAIENSKWTPPEYQGLPALDGKHDDEVPF